VIYGKISGVAVDRRVALVRSALPSPKEFRTLQSHLSTRIGTRTVFSSLALLGSLWTAAPAPAADVPNPAYTPTSFTAPAPPTYAATFEPTAAKQWVWLRSQGVYGFGYQRTDGLWVIDAGSKRLPAPAPDAPAQVQAQATPVAAPAPAPAGDPYGFVHWLNATRASFGLPAVGVDPSLSSWAAANNAQQAARGMGHHVMGPARRQNAAMGTSSSGVGPMWMNSPPHRAALLDPSIRWIGIAALGSYWTYNAN